MSAAMMAYFEVLHGVDVCQQGRHSSGQEGIQLVASQERLCLHYVSVINIANMLFSHMESIILANTDYIYVQDVRRITCYCNKI